MSLAHSAAQYMLSDSLIPEGSGDSRLKALALELPLDRIIKFVSVGLPLLLVSMAFAREISFVMMYMPALLWRLLVMPCLGADLLFIIDELDKSYNRSVRLAQSILELQQNSPDPASFAAELERAKRERYFEFPLLERYLQAKKHSYFLVCMLFLRSFLLLLFISAACLYLVYFHLSAFLQDEFSCFVKTGLLRDEPWVPELIQCKLTGLLVFQVVSVANGAVYLLLGPLIFLGLLRLFCWDRRFLSVYEVLPALGLGTNLGCPLNDLNVILLFLSANVSQLRSYSRLRAVCTLRGPRGQLRKTVTRSGRKGEEEENEEMEEREEREEEAREALEEGEHTLVDMMGVLAGMEGNGKTLKKQEPPPENLEFSNQQGCPELKEMPSCSYA
ncbi:UNVERIFIED_CONTAM: hypothetical protein FKN15_063543 [Acipenser sinensis]